MEWVRKAQPPTHTCRIYDVPMGQDGDLWRCDTCGKLWRVRFSRYPGDMTYSWDKATLWQRIRYRKKK